jgi:hypothetical protein
MDDQDLGFSGRSNRLRRLRGRDMQRRVEKEMESRPIEVERARDSWWQQNL